MCFDVVADVLWWCALWCLHVFMSCQTQCIHWTKFLWHFVTMCWGKCAFFYVLSNSVKSGCFEILCQTRLASAKVGLHPSSNSQLQMGESITFSDVKTCQNFYEKTEENGYVHANHVIILYFLPAWDIIVAFYSKLREPTMNNMNNTERSGFYKLYS